MGEPSILDVLFRICDHADALPSKLYLKSVSRKTWKDRGGQADIWLGSYDGQAVAIRDFRLIDEPQQTLKPRKVIQPNATVNYTD